VEDLGFFFGQVEDLGLEMTSKSSKKKGGER
jgi:hypothetical protein